MPLDSTRPSQPLDSTRPSQTSSSDNSDEHPRMTTSCLRRLAPSSCLGSSVAANHCRRMDLTPVSGTISNCPPINSRERRGDGATGPLLRWTRFCQPPFGVPIGWNGETLSPNPEMGGWRRATTPGVRRLRCQLRHRLDGMDVAARGCSLRRGQRRVANQVGQGPPPKDSQGRRNP
jgi:hypothetical protein